MLRIAVLSVWPGSDGADYHFQIDYKQSLEWFTEALITVNSKCLEAGVKLGIEPKPYEPRELYMIIPTAASAIVVAQKVNQACGGNNCGLTIDYGHQKMEATTASTACDLAEFAGVPVHKFDINDARQGRNDQDLMFGTISIPESVEYLYTTFVRNYQGWYSQDQFTVSRGSDPRDRAQHDQLRQPLAQGRAHSGAVSRRSTRRAGRRHRTRRPRRRLAGTRGMSALDATRADAQPSFDSDLVDMSAVTIGVDYGTNSVRAVVVDCERRTRASARACSTIRAATRACCSIRSSRTWRARIPRTTSRGFARRCGARSPTRSATPGFSRERVIGIGVDTTGSTPLPVDARGASAGDATRDGRATWRRTRGCGRTTRPPRRPRAITEIAAAHAPEYSGADRRHVLVGVVVVEDLALPASVAPDVFDAAASWVELADFVPAVLSGVDDPTQIVRCICAAGHKAMYSDAWGGLPSKAFLARLDPKLAELRDRLYDKAWPPGRPAGSLSPSGR